MSATVINSPLLKHGGLVLSAFLAAAFASNASAQDRPRKPRDYAPPPPPSLDAVCQQGLHPKKDIIIYDPLLPANLDDENHKSLAQAICHARPSTPAQDGKPAIAGATVRIYRDPAKPVLSPILINKPGLTLIAADSDNKGTVIVKQGPADTKHPSQNANGSCILINPKEGGRYDKDVTTTLVGFTFLAKSGSDKACIHVERGKLILKDSRIIMNGPGTAIYVSPTASLEFVGSNYLEHGVFYDEPGATHHSGIGVYAERSRDITVKNVRFEDLQNAVISSARSNTISAVHFADNTQALKVKDAAIISAYSPTLEVDGGEFKDNGTALELVAAGFDDPAQADAGAAPTATTTTASTQQDVAKRAFRGPVTIKNGAKFLDNDRAIKFDNAYPLGTFKVDGAEFDQNTEYALMLALPGSASPVQLSSVAFTDNSKAIVFDGALDGAMTLDGGSKISGATSDVGVVLEDGKGDFTAALTTTGDLEPAINVMSGWSGDLSLTVGEKKTLPQVLKYDTASSMCTTDLSDPKKRETFRERLQGMDVTVQGVRLGAMFGKPDAMQLSKRRLLYAQRVLCGLQPVKAPQ